MFRQPVLAVTALVLIGVLANISPVHAHGFGPRYDLPVPLWLYITGAGAAVALSFVVIGVFVRSSPGLHGYARYNLLQLRLGRWASHSSILFLIKLTSASLFILLIITGLFGEQIPSRNLTPTMIWVIWWVGAAYVSALIGNIWSLINPWKILYGWVEGLYGLLSQKKQLSLALPYPEKLGIWPGVILFATFAWVENVYPDSAGPRNLSVLVLMYSGAAWAGMFVFGKHAWLRHGEAFSLIFGFLSRFSPTEVRVHSVDLCKACPSDCLDLNEQCIDCYECFQKAQPDQREWSLRPFAAGLLRNERVSVSHVAFVLLMLATVSFDGFTATSTWASILNDMYSYLSFLGGQAVTGAQTAGLVWFVLMFPLIFLPIAALAARFSKTDHRPGEVARVMVYSLIPIALAYHLAHFFSFLIIQGQLIIPLASDPFGFGWDLFGSADYQVNIAAVNARAIWFVSIVTIVVGHVVAVYIAHVAALRLFRNHQLALRSQYPMLALMVSYTMLSLWILAQPIVEVEA